MEMPFSQEQLDKYSRQFIETDTDLSNLTLDGKDPLIVLASSYIEEIFKDFCPDSIVCKDGPGAVSNCPIGSKKTKVLAHLSSTQPKYLRNFFVNQTAMLDSWHRWPDYGKPMSTSRAKVIFVPKDSRGPRVISAEPQENQFLQQGIRAYMYEAIETSPLSRGEVNFKSQELNKQLAKETSSTRLYATIDLKEASDRVSLALVRRLFAGVPLLRDYLLDSRSSSAILPSGEIVESLNKFAPMGSALCFPVMAITVHVLIKAAMALRDSSLDEYLRVSPDRRVVVYGDDIIVSRDFAYLAMDTLVRYGLLVNTSKSYVGSPFAESCGCDAYMGVNVTPVRLRVSLNALAGPLIFPSGKRRFRDMTSDGLSLIETVNQLTEQGRPTAARYLLSRIEQTFGALPIGHSFSGAPCLRKHGELAEEILSEGGPRKPRYWSVKPVPEVNRDETGWTHLMRTIHTLGTHADQPVFGEYVLPRLSVIVARTKPKWFDHDFPGCGWLPEGAPKRDNLLREVEILRDEVVHKPGPTSEARTRQPKAMVGNHLLN
jgi:hypothetical protein